MTTPEVLALALGLLVLAYAVTCFVGTFARRKKHPLSGRDWNLQLCAWFAITLYAVYMLFYVGYTPPCEVMFTIEAFCMILGVNANTARLFRLWFRLSRSYAQYRERKEWKKDIVLADDSVAGSNTSASNALTKHRSWFATHAHLGQSRYLFNVVALSTVVEFGLVAAIYAGTRDSEVNFDLWPRDNCPSVDFVLTLVFVPLALSSAIGIWSALKLRKIQDGFWIKDEFYYTAISLPIMVPAFLLHERIGTVGGIRVATLVLGLTPGVIMTTTMQAVPLFMTFQRNYQAPSSSETNVSSRVIDVDSDMDSGNFSDGSLPQAYDSDSSEGKTDEEEDDYEVVRNYKVSRRTVVEDIFWKKRYARERKDYESMLKKEFAFELVFFTEEVMRYTRVYDALSDEQVCDTAMGIFNKYIHVGCEYEINISKPIRDGIVNAIHDKLPTLKIPDAPVKTGFQISFSARPDFVEVAIPDGITKPRFARDIYDATLKEVFDLMQNDTFERWLSKQAHKYAAAKKRIGGKQNDVEDTELASKDVTESNDGHSPQQVTSV